MNPDQVIANLLDSLERIAIALEALQQQAELAVQDHRPGRSLE